MKLDLWFHGMYGRVWNFLDSETGSAFLKPIYSVNERGINSIIVQSDVVFNVGSSDPEAWYMLRLFLKLIIWLLSRR